jgi:hypothetical protein
MVGRAARRTVLQVKMVLPEHTIQLIVTGGLVQRHLILDQLVELLGYHMSQPIQVEMEQDQEQAAVEAVQLTEMLPGRARVALARMA